MNVDDNLRYQTEGCWDQMSYSLLEKASPAPVFFTVINNKRSHRIHMIT